MVRVVWTYGVCLRLDLIYERFGRGARAGLRLGRGGRIRGRECGARWANNEWANLSRRRYERALDRDCVTLVVWGAAENNLTPLVGLVRGPRTTDDGTPKVQMVFTVQEHWLLEQACTSGVQAVSG
jgi:hypothetical protein